MAQRHSELIARLFLILRADFRRLVTWLKGHEKKTESRRGRNDKDSDVPRNRAARWLVLLLTMLIMVTVPGYLLGKIFSYVPVGGFTALGWIVGFGLGAEGFVYLLPRYFIVTVGQIRAFVTLNPLLSLFGIPGNPNVIYGPGDSISFPWERRQKKGNVSLDVVTLEWNEKVPGADVQLDISGSYQYKPDIKLADRYIAMDETTIRGGFIDLIEAQISERFADKQGDEAKRELGVANKDLGAYFGADSHTTPSEKVVRFEEEYGVCTIAVPITGIDLPEAAQKTRDAIDEARHIFKGVAELHGIKEETLREQIDSGKLKLQDYNNMVDRFFAASENANMDIKAIKFDGLAQAAEVFGKAFGEAVRPRA